MGDFIITFREGLEAALIVGIIYTLLAKAGASNQLRTLWVAVGAALVASVVTGLSLHYISESLADESLKTLFEGVMMFVAAGFLIYMISWMGRRRNIAQELREATTTAAQAGGTAVFGVVFFAIIREGFETAIFLFASNSMGERSWLGALGGIAVAVLLGVLMFRLGSKLPMAKFFTVSSMVLIVMAAGMVGYGMHETEEYFEESHQLGVFGIDDEDDIPRPFHLFAPTEALPEGANPAFYTFDEEHNKYYFILHDEGTIGGYVKALTGYNSDPNWPEFVLWLLTLVGSYWLYTRAKRPVKQPAEVVKS